MSSKTKIVVLHMKEVVYTAVFLALALILLVVFLIMFSGKKDSAKKPSVTTAASAENARQKKGFGAEECFEAFLHGKIRILRRKDFEPVRAPD